MVLLVGLLGGLELEYVKGMLALATVEFSDEGDGLILGYLERSSMLEEEDGCMDCLFFELTIVGDHENVGEGVGGLVHLNP